MSCLYVDRRGVDLRVDGGALVFYENGERIGAVPLAPLERVVVHGDMTLQARLLGQLGERGVGVVVLSGRKHTPTLLMARPHQDARRRLTQLRLAQDGAFCLSYARELIEAKLAAQARHVHQLRERRPTARQPLTHALAALERGQQAATGCADLAALRGVESAAAVQYFAALAACLPARLGFAGRNRHPLC